MSNATAVKKVMDRYEEDLAVVEEDFGKNLKVVAEAFFESGGSISGLAEAMGLPQPKVSKMMKELEVKVPRRGGGRTSKYDDDQQRKIAEKVWVHGANITQVAAAAGLSEQQVRTFGRRFGLYKPASRGKKADAPVEEQTTEKAEEIKSEVEDFENNGSDVDLSDIEDIEDEASEEAEEKKPAPVKKTTTTRRTPAAKKATTAKATTTKRTMASRPKVA